MLRKLGLVGLLLSLCGLLGGCTGIGDKSLSLSIVYGVIATASLLLLGVALQTVKRREPWLLILFSCVFVVNSGYFLLSISSTLEVALFANSLSYFGSVFLLPSMTMIILHVCKLPHSRVLPLALTALGIVVFGITLTPLYYTDTTLNIVNGSAVLDKHYGPLHALYPVYLFAYFAFMIAIILRAIHKKRLHSSAHAVLLAVAVFINISVWLLGQLVKIDFEFLSVSYIISELFLLGLHVMSTSALSSAAPPQPMPKEEPVDLADHAKAAALYSQLPLLTPTERAVFDLYLEGKSTKEVLTVLNIKENTLKYHNRNIYGKLEVSSRKELIRLAKMQQLT